MAEITKLKGLTAKIEGTYLTDSTPAIGTDGIQVEDDLWGSIEWGYLEENLRDNLAQAGLGRAGKSRPDGRWAHITAPVALKGTGQAYATGSVAPEADVLLRISGLEATHVDTGGSETVTYTPRSTGFESASVYAYSSGAQFNLVGCFAQLSEISFMPGQLIIATFDIWGVLDAISDTTHPTITYAYKDVQPPTCTAAGLTMNSYDPDDFSSFMFNMNTSLPERNRGNATAGSGGHAGYQITDWDPQFTAIIEKPPLASFNYYDLRDLGTLFAWDIGPVGPAQYNQITLSGPAGRVIDAPHSDDDGFAMVDLTVRCQNTDSETPDDAFSLLFD